MNEQLIVKNFGPIKDATVDFKRVTVFIGPTGGGKSTLAKLAAIFKEKNFVLTPELKKIQQEYDYLVKDYGMQGFGHDCEISWISSLLEFSVNDNVFSIISSKIRDGDNSIKVDVLPVAAKFFDAIWKAAASNNNLKDSISDNELGELVESMSRLTKYFSTPIYIPAERAFATVVDKARYSLSRAKINVAAVLENFLNLLEKAQENQSGITLPVFGIPYHYMSGESILMVSPHQMIGLSQAASGIQTALPLLLVVEELSEQGNQSFIVEEPELNLYPTAQQGLLNWLVEKCTKGENDLTITTHSPYILSSCNLLLEAFKVAQQRPELADEVAAIVPRECWINPDEFAAYYVADGTVKPITDGRTHLIGSNELDAVSGDISDKFRELLRLQKRNPTAV